MSDVSQLSDTGPAPTINPPAGVLTSAGGGSSTVLTILGNDETDAISIPAAARTFEGFREWAHSQDFPTHGRLTFADGELIVDMSPEYLETHNYVKAEISYVLYGLIRQEKLGRFFADRVLYTNEAARISTEPDAMFASHEAMSSGRCKLIPGAQGPRFHKEVTGTPDWVLEILSRGSVRKDQKVLWTKYYAAGIPEYWLVDATCEDQLYFKIYVRADNGYRLVPAPDGWAESPTFGRYFKLKRHVDENDALQYTLEVQKRS
jgi:Uma2 family endonuclease